MGNRRDTFQVGQVVSILIKQHNEMHEYSSKIQDVSATNLLISAPTERGRALDLPEGTEFTLITNEGGVMKSYPSKIERTRMGQVLLWVVTKPETEPGDVQRRSFYRLETFMPITFAFADPSEKIVLDYTQQGIVSNLSGSGLGMIYPQPISRGSTLGLLLPLDDHRLALWGEVVRCEPIPHPNLTRYIIGVKFLNITTKDQDHVIKYIYREQLKQRQKGLL